MNDSTTDCSSGTKQRQYQQLPTCLLCYSVEMTMMDLFSPPTDLEYDDDDDVVLSNCKTTSTPTDSWNENNNTNKYYSALSYCLMESKENDDDDDDDDEDRLSFPLSSPEAAIDMNMDMESSQWWHARFVGCGENVADKKRKRLCVFCNNYSNSNNQNLDLHTRGHHPSQSPKKLH
jgi:hypothetical protein